VNVEELMHASLLEVFGERDPHRRQDVMERIYTPEVTFTDVEERVVGYQAITEKVQRLLQGAPGFAFRANGPARVVQDMGYLAWDFGPPGQPPVVQGADIALVSEGRISSLHTMLLTP
jgi:hypothetical protein